MKVLEAEKLRDLLAEMEHLGITFEVTYLDENSDNLLLKGELRIWKKGGQKP